MRIAISGCGWMCGLGVGPQVWEALCAGRRGQRRLEDHDPRAALGGRGLRHWDRSALLLGAAALLALEEAGLEPPEGDGGGALAGEDWGVVIGSTHGSIQAIAEFDQEAVREGPQYVNPQAFANTVINAPAGRLALRLGMPGLNLTVATGVCSALDALDQAALRLEVGPVRAILCGSALGESAEIQEGYERAGRLLPAAAEAAVPFAPGRRGASLGEGGAVLLLERGEDLHGRGGRPLAWIAGTGSARGGEPGALEDAARRALEGAGVAPAALAGILAGACGEPEGDAVEAEALAALVAARVPVTAIQGSTGSCLEASAALSVAAAVRALEAGLLPPVAGLDGEAPRLAALDLVTGRPRTLRRGPLLVTARDPEGPCAALVLQAAGGGPPA